MISSRTPFLAATFVLTVGASAFNSWLAFWAMNEPDGFAEPCNSEYGLRVRPLRDILKWRWGLVPLADPESPTNPRWVPAFTCCPGRTTGDPSIWAK